MLFQNLNRALDGCQMVLNPLFLTHFFLQKIHKPALALAFLLLFWSDSTAQNPIGSAYEKFEKATTDTARFNALIPVFRQFLNEQSDLVRAKGLLDSVGFYARRSGDQASILRAISAEGGYHRMLNDWEIARSKYAEALQLAEKMGDPRRISAISYNLATLFADQKDTANQRIYLEKMVELARKNPDPATLADVLSELGKLAADQNKPAEAEAFFLQSRQKMRSVKAQNLPFWASQNFWHIKFLNDQKRHSEALRLLDSLETDLRLAPFPFFRCQVFMQKARSVRELGNTAQALLLAEKAVVLADSVDNPLVKTDILEELVQCQKAVGNDAAALKTLEKKIELDQKTRSETTQRNLAIAEARFQNQRKQQQITALEGQRRFNFALIGLLVAALSAAILAYHRSRLSVLLQQQKQKMVDAELAHARDLLAEFTERLMEKNALLEAKSVASSRTDTEPPTVQALETLLDTTILTGSDWERFKFLFEKVHPDFLRRLVAKYDDLSAGDTRLMTIARLGLPQKEAAAMLGISPESVRKGRQRLRKKIGLAEDQNLEQVVAAI